MKKKYERLGRMEIVIAGSHRNRDAREGGDEPGRKGLKGIGMLVVMGLAAVTGCVDLTAWRTDDVIADAVKHRLYEYAEVNLLEVEVSVSNRVVYLSGEADEFSYKEIAGRVARQVDRVVDVVNKVQVEP